MAKEKRVSLKYTDDSNSFKEFVSRLRKCKKLHRPLANTLANIFSMRYIGNKTHGDLAEVGITEFINRFMYNYECLHVGKEYFRSKEHEEDIAVRDLSKENSFYMPISLKAYGVGPLQLSTDKGGVLYEYLQSLKITDTKDVSVLKKIKQKISKTVMFNVLPLIYKEKEVKTERNIKRQFKNECNILLYDVEKMEKDLKRIVFVDTGKEFNFSKGLVQKGSKGKFRKHPIFLFLNGKNEYMCEVRYGNATANALQRGLWSDTRKGIVYFNSLFKKWIPYEKRGDLLTLIQQALNCSIEGHKEASICLVNDLNKRMSAKAVKDGNTI